MKRLAILFFFLSLSLQAQFNVGGVVKDASTNHPLPFATIVSDEGIYTISDVEGKFQIQSKSSITSLKVSYIGVNFNPTQNSSSIGCKIGISCSGTKNYNSTFF
jgi:hypothetical protein